jgi:GrpB-like predicted nucleotidyltransferase (UPF0157 family)
MILGLPKDILKFLPYNPEWERLFEEGKQQLQSVIGNDILDSQHIGSTSIPGIIAKPILDIGIAVHNFEAAALLIEPITRIGYTYRGEQGIPKRYFFIKGNPKSHHLPILEIESTNWKNHLIFRDYLKQNPEIAKQYAELKIQLLQQFNGDCPPGSGKADRDAYQKGKQPFVEQVLQQAQS